MRVMLASAILIATTPTAFAMDRDLAKAYALSFATAYEAKTHCAGMTMNQTKLSALRQAASLDDSDDDWLSGEFDHLKPSLERALRDNGVASWCASAWSLMGPEGIGTIRRD